MNERKESSKLISDRTFCSSGDLKSCFYEGPEVLFHGGEAVLAVKVSMWTIGSKGITGREISSPFSLDFNWAMYCTLVVLLRSLGGCSSAFLVKTLSEGHIKTVNRRNYINNSRSFLKIKFFRADS